ncbi:MAG: thiamine biosynthesis protein ThiS [Deltaproteobacteria bacterium CG_4_10_14_3_um_filter_60_8]|nr:MAG: thiamine biosynthesis protein ThiS [Desulfobacterales bacterium CG2_30_60_27]PIP44047.1 MAG: thiamine biosynthesis protein ThiS [Deltaproteobacteria bacterium CG23_combo_of_CG06-09_8_20_14_all_60_8]PIY21296.1 MAG: thiamine biosynthesis protein ThiS [Deltaproteobacteria bacterium CG_4_10_14_3_um_filter_60_8]
MNIRVNGETQVLEEGAVTVARLLDIQKVESPDMVSVQRNGDFVERANFGSTLLAENDEIEFLYFMGGGACKCQGDSLLSWN